MTERASPSTTPGSLGSVAREIARGGLAGVLTGVLVVGPGSRLAMRLSSLVDPSARGRTTEAGFTVGEVTLAGTIELMIFVGLFGGIVVGVVWVITRPWLPAEGIWRYGLAALIGVAMGGRFAIDGRNIDFVILDPVLLQVSIYVVLTAIVGVTVVHIDRWLERRLPPARRRRAVEYWVLTGLGLLMALPLMASLFSSEECSCVSPPRLSGALLVVVGLMTMGLWVRGLRGTSSPDWLPRTARVTVIAMCVAGLFHLGGEIAHFV